MRRDIEKAKDYAYRHKVPRFYTSAEELINDEEVNAIYIATPPSSHEQYTEMALKAGKPVYVEKPVSLNVKSVIRMLEMEKKYATKVSVAHYRRALPLFQKIKQLVADKTIGSIKEVQLSLVQPPQTKLITQTTDNWRTNPAVSGGGLFHDLSPHQLDILYWLFREPEKVVVHASSKTNDAVIADNVKVQAMFASNIQFSGNWSFDAVPDDAEEVCIITGDKGIIEFSFFRGSNIVVTIDGKQQHVVVDAPVTIQHPHIEQVVKFFSGEAENPCSLQDALITMRIIEKAVL
jgi:predicted dehydrogenase